jgi:hypothetical protein
MDIEFLRKHAAEMRTVATETNAQLSQDPGNFFLQIVAKNQEQAANDAEHEFQLALDELSERLTRLPGRSSV